MDADLLQKAASGLARVPVWWFGSDGIHLAYAAYFGPFPLFQLAPFSLGLSSKKKCSNEMLDKIKVILRDT